MTTPQSARSAYLTTTKTTGTPRATEYKVLSEVTSALRRGEKVKNEDYPLYIDALSRNLRLWTILGTDAASENNGLPTALRSQIFYLFEFTRHHTAQLLRQEKGVTTAPLIEINSHIMAGLRTSIPEQEAS